MHWTSPTISFFVDNLLAHSRTFPRAAHPSESRQRTTTQPTTQDQSMISTRLAAARLLRPTFARLSSSSSTTTSSPAVQAKVKPTTPTVAPQSPNRVATWSTNQRLRPAGQSGPRFEQTIMELQPNPLSAMELIANEPIRFVHSRKAICDGGTSAYSYSSTPGMEWKVLIHSLPFLLGYFLLVGIGPLGHPKVYINLVRTLVCSEPDS